MTTQPEVCIVCGKAEPKVYNVCYHCQRPLHQECGTQEQLAGNFVSCPEHTQEVTMAQEMADLERQLYAEVRQKIQEEKKRRGLA